MPAFAEFLDQNLAIAAAVTVGAGLMRGFTGFGSAMMMAPVFALLFGPKAMIPLVTLLEMVVTVQLIPSSVRQADWRFVGPLALAAVAAMPVGSALLLWLDPLLLTRVVAGIVAVFVLVMASGWRYRGRRRLPATLGVGAFSGAMVATTAIGGPPVLVYMLAGGDRPTTLRANIISYFAAITAALLVVLWWTGLLDLATLLRTALLAPSFVLAAWLGSRGFRQASERLYRRVALAFLFCVAVYGLFG